MASGRLAKAARGELRQLLPVGLDYDDDGQVMLSADEAVRSAIGQVHALFGQLASARQVMMTLRAQGLRLPAAGDAAGGATAGCRNWPRRRPRTGGSPPRCW